MRPITKKYGDYIIIVLVGIVLALTLILITDVHVARIDQQMQQTIEPGI